MGSGCCKCGKEEIVGHHVANEHEIFHNEMKEVEVPNMGQRVVVARFHHKFYAFGATCPHNGAPLALGAFRHGKVRCPWHGACFDATTGDIEDFPGIECIPTFKINRHKLGGLYIEVRKSDLEVTSVLRPLGKRSQQAASNELHDTKIKIGKIAQIPALQTIVIIGSGAAGFTCAITLRQQKFEGRVLMLTSDWFHPYDRTKLSKDLTSHWADIKLRDEDFYKEYDIHVITNSAVEKINFEEQKLKISHLKAEMRYSQLLIATGIKPRVYDVDGADLDNIFTIYSLKDAQRIRLKSLGKRIVILGSSFIAMEMASSLDELASSVVVICRGKWPYGLVYGRAVGTALLMNFMARSKRVQFKMVDEVQCFQGNSKREVTAVQTRGNKVYPCDLVIIAEGGVGNTEFLEDTGLALIQTNKTIPVGRYLKTTAANVFAAGDVTTFPSLISVSGHASLAQWSIACKHGRAAALNMLGIKTPVLSSVPFHWTTVWGETIRCCGNGQNHNEVIIFGKPSEMKFCALYRRDGIVLAAVTCNSDPIASELAFDLEHHIPYKRTEYPPYVTDIFEDPPYVGDRYLMVNFGAASEGVRATDARRLVSMPRDATTTAMNVTRDLNSDEEKERLMQEKQIAKMNKQDNKSKKFWKSKK